MRQYTNKEQTQHLIELGFPKPNVVDVEGFLPEDMAKYYASGKDEYGCLVCYDNYSIGQLIEFLGMHLMGIHPTTVCDLPIIYVVQYQREPNKIGYKQIQGELIDKLYDACVELKKEGII